MTSLLSMDTISLWMRVIIEVLAYNSQYRCRPKLPEIILPRSRAIYLLLWRTIHLVSIHHDPTFCILTDVQTVISIGLCQLTHRSRHIQMVTCYLLLHMVWSAIHLWRRLSSPALLTLDTIPVRTRTGLDSRICRTMLLPLGTTRDLHTVRMTWAQRSPTMPATWDCTRIQRATSTTTWTRKRTSINPSISPSCRT